MKPGGRFEEMNELRDQLETFLALQIFDGCEFRFEGDLTIPRLEYDTTVIARFNLTGSAKRSGEIYSGSARMKKIEWPDVYRASGKIDSCWC
jgi:hypothetical protein